MTCIVDYVEGDTGTVHGPVTCLDKNGNIIDLTGATVNLLYRIEGGSLVTRLMTVNSPATAGIVQYQFITGELTEGEMIGEIQITDVSGFVTTEVCKFKRNIRAKV